MALYITTVPTVKKIGMIEFVDTHTHLFVTEFDEDRGSAVQRAVDAGVKKLCLPSITLESIPSIMEMCEEFPGVCYPMIGLHPTELGENYKETLERMHALLKNDGRYIAVGEVGLDFYWDDTRKREQLDAFDAQISWAAEAGLPLAIHSRSAFNELYDVMDAWRGKGLTGVFHCFSGNEDEARKLLSFDGFYLGIGGVVTYKKSVLPSVLSNVPLERILLETDSPYLPPVPFRGKRNESSYIPYIAGFLSGIYGCDIEKVAQVTSMNAYNLFPKLR